MFSKNLESIMSETKREAESLNIAVYPLELLIKNIILKENVLEFFNENKVEVKNLLNELEISIKEYVQEYNRDKEIEEGCDLFTVDVIALASLDVKKQEAISQENNLLMTEYNILSATLRSENSEAYRILNMFDITYKMFLSKRNSESQESGIDLKETEDYFESNSYGIQPKKEEAKKSYLVNLNEKVIKGKIGELVGRDLEILKISTILSRKSKNNPIVIGKSGVGKTALVEGLAHMIVNNNVIDSLKGKTIYSLDLGAIVSGTKYRGEFEQRLDNVIKQIKKEDAILFIDEVHSIINSSNGSSGVDISGQLLPHLTSGELTVIGATTIEDYLKTFMKNAPLNRRFNKVNIDELTEYETIELMSSIKETYEDYHQVKYEDGVIEKIVKLTGRYLYESQFPDKALDVFDEVAAVVKIDKTRKTKAITLNDVYNVISRVTQLPLESIKDNGTNKSIINLADKIKETLYGQDEAVEAVSEAMMLSYAGLKRENKPIGSFLCVGPTGVGKTELAKALSNRLNMNFVRFDMSEYMDQMSATKFLGATDGYIGSDNDGTLRVALKESPYSVVLFDEFEKAHPVIQNIFLQILDEGEIKDSKGRMISFKNTIILFTSNAGVDHSSTSMGFNIDNSDSGINMKVIENKFKPEFRNRITKIIEFKPLLDDTIEKVANKSIKEIADLLFNNRGISVKWNKAVNKYISEEGFDKKMGARPIERKVESLISKELSKLILENDLKESDTIKITKVKSGLKIVVE